MVQKVNGFHAADIDSILGGSYSQEPPEQAVFDVIYCLGRDAGNETEFHYAHSHLLKLTAHPNRDVRAYSVLALSMLAFHWPVDKDKVIPIILEEWSAASEQRKGWLITAAEDLQFLGWDISLPCLE